VYFSHFKADLHGRAEASKEALNPTHLLTYHMPFSETITALHQTMMIFLQM
jgi:hypothetical protein